MDPMDPNGMAQMPQTSPWRRWATAVSRWLFPVPECSTSAEPGKADDTPAGESLFEGVTMMGDLSVEDRLQAIGDRLDKTTRWTVDKVDLKFLLEHVGSLHVDQIGMEAQVALAQDCAKALALEVDRLRAQMQSLPARPR